MQDWSNSFNKKGEMRCERSDGLYYVVGFERDGTDNLNGIKKAKCCSRDQAFWNTPTQCQMPDWATKMDRWEAKYSLFSHFRSTSIFILPFSSNEGDYTLAVGDFSQFWASTVLQGHSYLSGGSSLRNHFAVAGNHEFSPLVSSFPCMFLWRSFKQKQGVQKTKR